MILSLKQIEEIAVAVTGSFNRFFYGTGVEKTRRYIQCTPIDQLASDFLGLRVSFTTLSSDGSIRGLTAYADTEYEMEEQGITIPLEQNQVLLDERFIQPNQIRRLSGQRRFTLAHECAHQILYQCESEGEKLACRKQYAQRSSYSLRKLKTREDWNEWQANALGAALLMPQREIDWAMRYLFNDRKLVNYEGHFDDRDCCILSALCQQLGVSRSAAVIRLRQLGYLVDRPYLEMIGLAGV